MNQLQKLFHYKGRQVRTVVKDGEPWFIAKDVCDVLGLSNPSESLKALDQDEKSTLRISEGGPEVNIINEAGLYTLIIRSNKPEAKLFKRWVTHEVLPTIRKTGGYVANEDLFIETYLPHADEQTKMTFRATLAIVRKQNEQIAAMKPKVEYFDALVDRNLLTNIRDTAKELHIGQNAFVQWLLERKFIYRDQKGKLKPYAQYVPDLFELKEWTRGEKADVQTLITPKGRETFRLLLQKQVAGVAP